MNFWEVLKDPKLFELLKRRLETTPLSQDEFHNALNVTGGSVIQATAFFIRNRQSRQGLGNDYTTPTSRLRRGMNEQVSAWLTAVDGLADFHKRLRRVEIWNNTAQTFIRKLDSPKTFFYCDPPYLHQTRTSKVEYGPYEMDEEAHACLLEDLRDIQGKFILSGYYSNLYNEFARKNKWRVIKFQIDNKASSSKTKELKTECLWMNY